MLGFSQEIYGLALAFVDSPTGSCRSSAQSLINLDLNIKVVSEIYHTIIASIHKIVEIRKGFFCVLCDAKTQSKLTDFWTSSNLFNKVIPRFWSLDGEAPMTRNK